MDFEIADGISAGNLHNQDSWQVTQGSASVITTLVSSGSRSVLLAQNSPPTQITRAFGAPASGFITHTDLFVRPNANQAVGQSTVVDVESSGIGLVRCDSTGHVLAFDGNGNGGGHWVLTGKSIALDSNGQATAWTRFTVRQDYSAKKWDLYVDGTMVAHDLGFRDNARTHLGLFKLTAAAATDSYFDDFYVGAANPLFADADDDGLDDAWETTHGLSAAVVDRTLDLDSDGLTNIEEYILGTDPNDTDSDNDDLPDAWEVLHGANPLLNDAGADPGGVGRTLLQSYQQDLSPWPAPVVANGLRVWYRADGGVTKDGANKVSRWVDMSGHGAHAEQADVARQPVWSADGLNGRAGLSFDGSAAALQTLGAIDLFAGGNDVSVLVVVQPDESQVTDSTMVAYGGYLSVHQLAQTNRYELLCHEPDNSVFNGGTVAIPGGQPKIMQLTKEGDHVRGYLNGTLQTDSLMWWNGNPQLTQAFSKFTLGATGTQQANYHGRIAEVLVYNRALTTTEREAIEAALTAKYLNTDSDSDGLPDLWEQQHLGTLGYSPSAPPPGLAPGRTLLQSYQQGLNPWPSSVVTAGLRVWYRADAGVTKDGANKVSRWVDMSGHGAHAEQADAARQPVWSADGLNGRAGLDFDGTAAALQTLGTIDLFAAGNDVSVLVVVQPDESQAADSTVVGYGDYLRVHQLGAQTNHYELLCREPDNSLFNGGTVAIPGGQPKIVQLTKEGDHLRGYLNGTLQTDSLTWWNSNPQLTQALSRFTLGATGSLQANYHGRIAEVLVYNRALTTTEREAIETALTAKYLSDTPPPADTDGDGLPDAWEMQKLGTLEYSATADPYAVGRTLLQSYQGGLSPLPAAVVATGLRAWFRADLGLVKNGGNVVTQWRDLSGQGMHIGGQLIAGPLWVGGAIGGEPAVGFDGAVQLTSPALVPLLDDGSAATVIAVIKPEATQGDDATILGWGSNGFQFRQRGDVVNSFGVSWYSPSFYPYGGGGVVTVAATPQLVSVVLRTGTDVKGYLNGVLKVTEPDGSSGIRNVPSLLQIGSLDGDGYHGQVAEILVYSRALTDTERAQIEAVLIEKYSLDDVDGDGLPDAWEMQKLGTLEYSATADPYAVGRTLLQSYQGSLSPLPAPVVATGLRAWFRADLGLVKNGGNVVTQWRDLSGQGMHVGAQLAAGPLWVGEAIGGEPAVGFDGAVQLTSPALVPLLDDGSAATVIAVIKPEATQVNDATILGWGSNGFQFRQRGDVVNSFGVSWYSPSFYPYGGGGVVTVAATPQLVSVVLRTGTDVKGYLNGVLKVTEADGSNGIRSVPSLLQIGGLDGAGYHGQVAEILVYSRALTDTERTQIEAALTAKYLSGPPPPDLDTDDDGLLDAWEIQYFGPGNLTATAAGDEDGDGKTNLEEFTADTDPTDYYNGATPVITVVAGGNGSPGTNGLLQVRVANSAGGLLVNAPVVFTVATGSSQLAAIDGPGAPVANAVTVRTTAGGTADAYYRTPTGQTATGSVTVQAGAASTTLTFAPSDPPFPSALSIDFETDEGYVTHVDDVVVPLGSQQGWNSPSSVTIVEADATAPSGENVLRLSAGSQASHPITPAVSSGLVFVDFYARVAADTEYWKSSRFWLGGAFLSFARDGSGTAADILAGYSGGDFFGFDPTGTKVALNASRTTAWHRYTLRLDYDSHRWDLYLDNKLIAADVFLAALLDSFAVEGDVAAPSWIDRIRVVGSHPLFTDTDRDGMDDAWEIAHGLDPAVNDRGLDPDHDDLSNIQEYAHGTDPQDTDSDHDGLPDAWEVAHGLNPADALDAAQDADNDGLSNLVEYKLGTDIRQAVTDSGGIPDAELDFDGDGMSNLQEVQQGTDPIDYYNGQTPVVTPLADYSTELGPDSLFAVRVTDAAGHPLANAPITFTTSAESLLTQNPYGSGASATVEARTDDNGIARVYVRPAE